MQSICSQVEQLYSENSRNGEAWSYIAEMFLKYLHSTSVCDNGWHLAAPDRTIAYV